MLVPERDDGRLLLAEPLPPPNPAPPPQVAFRFRGFSVGWPCAVGNEAPRASGAWAGAGGTAWLVKTDAGGAAARRPSIPAHGKLPQPVGAAPVRGGRGPNA